MKPMDISCVSQAATAICLSMEQLGSSSSPSSSSILLGSCSPAIDRYNPIITDSRRVLSKPPALPPSQTHLYKNHHKKKSSKKVPWKGSSGANHGEKNDNDEKVKVGSSQKGVSKSNGRKSWSCTKPGGFISPPGSTRYLLSDDKVLVNGSSDFNPSLKLCPTETSKGVEETESCEGKRCSSSSTASPDQVVVLRVSLHCRGCERKMRKHISRMEGVTSFNIDFAAKKVTVSGNITPLEVLSSISKVKNAQLWSPTNQSYYYPDQFKNNAYRGGSAAAANWMKTA